MNFTERNFTAREVLCHEAEALSKHGPSRGEPKEPESDLETFTRLRNFGAGVCRVRQWPDDEDPYAWGSRNESLLLDEPIHAPARWELAHKYREQLLGPIDSTYLGGFRGSDGGDEEQFLVVLDNILRRLTVMAFIFFIQLWRKNPQHSSHSDYHVALDALHDLSFQLIRTSERTSSHEIAVVIPRTELTELKGKYERFKPLVIGTVQSTGFTERIHVVNESGCRTADEVLSSMLENFEDTNDLFMKFGLRNDWQSAAVGHIIQVKLSIFCSSSC
jgi:hypothetical protein